MHEEIVVQKMHQITPPRTDGAFAERPCGNPQCGKCKKPRHIAVGFCNAEQKATIKNAGSEVDAVSDVDAESNFAAPIHPQAEWEEQSKRASVRADSSPPMSIATRTPSPPRNIAARTPSQQRSLSPQRSFVARTPSPPTVVEAPSNPFADNVTPHMASWQVDADTNADALLIRNGTPVTQEDYAKVILVIAFKFSRILINILCRLYKRFFFFTHAIYHNIYITFCWSQPPWS
jgi:hypothetical protein